MAFLVRGNKNVAASHLFIHPIALAKSSNIVSSQTSVFSFFTNQRFEGAVLQTPPALPASGKNLLFALAAAPRIGSV
ncbi:MAG: hypothetical protein D6691_10270 [Candidatus Hydrogenedentota bacterium]|nr:MAG: hypothetical protein D6691_10270 [Candidatus Hydrogenedentota bacterium]